MGGELRAPFPPRPRPGGLQLIYPSDPYGTYTAAGTDRDISGQPFRDRRRYQYPGGGRVARHPLKEGACQPRRAIALRPAPYQLPDAAAGQGDALMRCRRSWHAVGRSRVGASRNERGEWRRGSTLTLGAFSSGRLRGRGWTPSYAVLRLQACRWWAWSQGVVYLLRGTNMLA